MKIREFFDRQIQNMVLWSRYGESVDSIQRLKTAVNVLHNDIKLTADEPNWKEKRGIYRVMVKPRHEGLLWMMMQGYRNDEFITMCQELNLIEWIYVHVYEDGYNHKVVISNRPDMENFHNLPNYLCVSFNFSEFAVTMYLDDCSILLGDE